MSAIPMGRPYEASGHTTSKVCKHSCTCVLCNLLPMKAYLAQVFENDTEQNLNMKYL